MVNDCSGEVRMVPKSAAVFAGLRRCPPVAGAHQCLRAPSRGRPAQLPRGLLAGGKLGSLGLRQVWRSERCLIPWYPGLGGGHQQAELAVALAAGHWSGGAGLGLVRLC